MPEDQIFDDQARSEIPTDYNQPDPGWKLFLKKYKLIFIAAASVILVVGTFWYFLSRSGDGNGLRSENVLLMVKGPEQITSGNEVEYTVTYRNGENADLVGVSMELYYPTGFKFKSATPAPATSIGQTFNLPILKQGADGEIVIRGKLSGATGERKEIKARLHYRLSNFNSEFAVEESVFTTLQAPELVMDINGPVDVVNGQDTTFVVSVTNVSEQSFDNLAVQLNYPLGFSFTSSDIPASKNNNYWQLGSLISGMTQSIEITGSFTGETSEEKLVRADLGQIINNNFAPQIVATASFKIIPSSLEIVLISDPPIYASLGQTINYTIKYSNHGSIGLGNLVITATIDGTAIDFSRISARDGIITSNMLTWKAATLSSLAVLSPNERGEVTFTVPLKETLTTNLKNQTINATATIVSQEINKPTRAADSAIKLISDMELSVNGGVISGANPMQVGQTTTVAITMLLSNLSNDLANTEVIASLPLPTSAWKNIVIPDSEKARLSYDPNSGKIRWKIGDLPAFTGKFIPALQATFQLDLVPTESDRGKRMTLLKDVQATGTDIFVNETVQTENMREFTTSDLSDELANGGNVEN